MENIIWNNNIYNEFQNKFFKKKLYLTNLNNKSKIDELIPDGVLKCDESKEDFILILYSLYLS